MKKRFRNNALLIISTLVFFTTLALVAVVFDFLYYRQRKWELIKESPNFEQLTSLQSTDFTEMARRLFEARIDLGRLTVPETSRGQQLERQVEELESDIRESIEEAIAAGDPILSVELVLDDETLVAMEHPNPHAFSDFRNSILPFPFSRVAQRKYTISRGGERWTGNLNLNFTTPANMPEIHTLTRECRYYLIGILVVISGLYLLMLRYVILPLRVVTEAIQGSSADHVRFIESPYSRIEKLYNRMARDAQLVGLSTGRRRKGERQLRQSLPELVEELAPRVCRDFGFQSMLVLEVQRSAEEGVRIVGRLPAEPVAGPNIDLEGLLSENQRLVWEEGAARLLRLEAGAAGLACFVAQLPENPADRLEQLMVLVLPAHAESRNPDWYQETAEALAHQVYGLIERQIMQSSELFREKSEANISLSRNLGHDLTNIIATNKLELMTVKHILQADTGKLVDTPEMAEVLRESLTRLLDNTRSLQEIVNLYRAYEYLNSPRQERVDVNRLTGEIIEIFQLSMSASVAIERDFAEGLPEAKLEPRLVKLAVFNLLSNAQDAIRSMSPADQERGKISVQTSMDRARNKILVRISDTGPGIRTPDGKLAGPERIKRIFELGYTTKANGQGEGLGLNWVRSILTEFHAGEIRAANRREGGAEFVFTLNPAPASKDDEEPERG